jgi:hypothetical protein
VKLLRSEVVEIALNEPNYLAKAVCIALLVAKP